jgi:hypothetical protein
MNNIEKIRETLHKLENVIVRLLHIIEHTIEPMSERLTAIHKLNVDIQTEIRLLIQILIRFQNLETSYESKLETITSQADSLKDGLFEHEIFQVISDIKRDQRDLQKMVHDLRDEDLGRFHTHCEKLLADTKQLRKDIEAIEND